MQTDDPWATDLPRFEREAIHDCFAAMRWEHDQKQVRFPHQTQSLQMQANPAKSRYHCKWCRRPA